MARSENQKLKALYIAKYFIENSDENHAITANDLADYLRTDCEIEAERHSVYRDIAALRDIFELDIAGTQGGRYRLMSRQFSYDDLLLLAECVHAAKFISAGKAKELVSTICEFCSIYQAETLQEEVFLCDRVKTTIKETLEIISVIRQAMATKRDGKPHTPQKICFKYTTYSIENIYKQIERHDGALYIVSPYKLLLNEGHYYLLAFDNKSQEMRTYRIDRMKNVRLLNEPREGADAFAKLDIATYTRRVFSMFSGERKRVSIRFENRLLDTALERFGTDGDVFYRPDGKQHFIVTTDVEISEQFYGWLFGFGMSACLVAPEEVRQSTREYLQNLMGYY